MARGRMISKCLSTSEKYASLTHHAGKLAEFCQALFPLLVAHADDHGRQAGDEFTVKHLVHPTSKRKLEDFTTALRAIHDSGLVVWYQVNGAKYLQVKQFEQHQTGLHKRSESKIPEVPGNSREFPLKGTELKGTEGKRTEGSKDPSSADADYERFKQAYPASRRVGGNPGKRAFVAALKSLKAAGPVPLGLEVDVLIEALEQHQRSEQWQTPKLIPLMTTWLNQERWAQVLPEVTRDIQRLGTRKTTCRHEPMCETRTVCIERMIAEGRAERKVKAEASVL